MELFLWWVFADFAKAAKNTVRKTSTLTLIRGSFDDCFSKPTRDQAHDWIASGRS